MPSIQSMQMVRTDVKGNQCEFDVVFSERVCGRITGIWNPSKTCLTRVVNISVPEGWFNLLLHYWALCKLPCELEAPSLELIEPSRNGDKALFAPRGWHHSTSDTQLWTDGNGRSLSHAKMVDFARSIQQSLQHALNGVGLIGLDGLSLSLGQLLERAHNDA